jgi:uncharacterized protein YycO
MTPHIALYRGVSLLSKAIRCFNWGPYSHASWLTADGTEIEAWRKGVTESPGIGSQHTPGTRIDLFTVAGLTPELRAAADAAMRASVGLPYDWLGILGFLARARVQREGRLFCSELVFSRLDNVGLPLLKRVPAFKVFPALLSYSPLLTLTATVFAPKAPQ